MARFKAQHADIQQDKKLFEDYCAEIRHLGVDAIVQKGKVSRTTVYDWMRHKPIDQKTEDAIRDSVIACRSDRAEERRQRQEFARQALTA